MKNAIKVMTALKQGLPGHRVENFLIDDNYDMQSIFVDGKCVGHFDKDFFDKDLDNPEIEIKIKGEVKNFKAFIASGGYAALMRTAVERGLAEWEEGSQPNN